MKKKVTVICPICNEEKHISECIDSLLNQSVGRDSYEIIVVDGMSDDDTRDILDNYTSKYNNLYVINNTKRYVPFALNIGLKNSNGDVIIRVDGHAIIAQDYIERCLEYLNKTNADCVGGKIESINSTLTGKAISLTMSSKFGVGNSRFRTSSKEGYVDTLAFGAYKKKVFEKIGNFDEELIRCQDDEFNYRLRKYGGKIYLTPKIKSWYYPRSSFNKLWKQYFGYGLWKIRVLQKHFKAMQFRQFVPALFVLSITSTIIAGFFFSSLWLITIFILSFYLLTSLIISLQIALRNNIKLIPRIWLSFPYLHFSYGIGFIWGLIKFFKYWHK